ncbi:MAG: hypothetical protein JSV34_01840 [Candidatus Omnitrophota bacterium]|nr:MAG: hypothetical protein JSV34_01840 [Candidatus Omnitrophota bacterium]
MKNGQMSEIRCQIIYFLFSFLCFLSSVFCFLSYAQEAALIPVIKFKDADIRVVLQSISEKAVKDGKKVNILASPGVQGFVSVSLENVDWQTALDAVLKTYDYSYIWVGDSIILVDTVERIGERQAQERQRQEVEVPRLKVFKLKYLDASDASKAVRPLLSAVGRVTVLEATGQAGWEFGADVTKRSRASEGKVSRTKVLVVSDVSKKLDEVEQLLAAIDVMPQQILIKSKIMEVQRDLLRDIGFDWGTGQTGASSTTLTYVDMSSDNDEDRKQAAGHFLADQITPTLFGPRETTTLTTTNTGLKVALKKLAGTQFETIMHALEEDARTNTLSAPTILTLNNQEASILVGEKFPIVETKVSTETNQIVGGSLEGYQDIGIQLNVVPQICGDKGGYISLIIHPAVTSSSSTVAVQDSDGNTLVEYPRITTRETETQIVIKDGDTIVMGGLLREITSKQEIGIPFLKDIPFLGKIFRRETDDVAIIDLLIFVTAEILDPGQAVSEQLLDTERVMSEFKKQEKIK